MAADGVLAGLSAAGLLGIYADLAFNMYSAMNSSPQTTELFAAERSATLWKYVVIGDVGVVAFGLFGSFLAQSLWPVIGAGTVGICMHLLYRHALAAGGGSTAEATA